MCLACNTELKNTKFGEYSLCPNCGTYRYISQRSAEEENAEYFEQAEYYNVKSVSLYKVLFKIYRLIDIVINPSFIKSKYIEYKINKNINKKNNYLEIGFGNGRWIRRYLRRGKDVYGIDLSSEAVSEFKNKYPEYGDRVEQATKVTGCYDVIYANAIFEHLDNPDQFLQNIHASLQNGGELVLGIPTINERSSNIKIDADINFWKPCHRVIYSIEGLTKLLDRNGFRIVANASNDTVVYRLLNALLARGVKEVHKYRTPFYRYSGNNNFVNYLVVLLRLPFVRSQSVWSKLLIEKYSESDV